MFRKFVIFLTIYAIIRNIVFTMLEKNEKFKAKHPKIMKYIDGCRVTWDNFVPPMS